MEGDAATLDLTGRFRDPEGGALTLTVSSSDEAVATATLADSGVTIAPVTPGRVTVAVTARDQGDRATTLPVRVTVYPSNRPPEAKALADRKIRIGSPARVELASAFTDPDEEDVLTYTATSSNEAVAPVAVEGTGVRLTPKSLGQTTVAVTARDPKGLEASLSFNLTVEPKPPPRPPRTPPGSSSGDGDGGSVTPPPPPPPPPTRPNAPAVAPASSTSLKVTWTAPANARPAITDYDVQYREGSSGAFIPVTHDGTDLSTTITGLTPGTSYEVQVRAINTRGKSTWSASGMGATIELGTSLIWSAILTVGETFGSSGYSDLAGKLSDTDFVFASTSYELTALRTYQSKMILDVAEKTISDRTPLTLVVGTTKFNLGEAEERETDYGSTYVWTVSSGFALPPVNHTVGVGLLSSLGRPIEVVGSIDTQTLSPDGSQKSVDVSNIISSSASLRYEVSSSNPNVAAVSISGSTVTITSGEEGNATITLTAHESQGNSVQATFTVVVAPVPERPNTPRVEVASSTSLRVIWTEPDNTGPAITDYDVQYRIGSSGTFTDAGYDGTDLTTTIPGLTPGTRYEVQVRATNAESTGDWSPSGSERTSDNQWPEFTEGTRATRRFDEHTAAGENIGNPVIATDDTDTGTLTYSLEGRDAASFTIDETSGQLQTEAGVTYDYEGATISYSVRVRVEDEHGGHATISVTIEVNNVKEPPGRPDAPTVRNVSSTSLTVIWTAPANTGPAITDYDVQYRQGSGGAFTDVTHEGTARTTTITHLTPDRSYEVQVRAENDEGESVWSPLVDGTTRANQAPTFSDGTSTTRSFAENTAAGQNIGNPVSATDPDGDGGTLAYSLEGGDAASFTIAETSGQLQTNDEVTYDHETQSTYLVTVKAVDEHGGSATIAVTITLTDVDEPPAAPAKPTVSVSTLNSLTVIWTAPANTGPEITDYDVQYRQGSSGAFTDVTHEGTARTTTIMHLTPDRSYQVQVRAENDEGESAWSPLVDGTTRANQAPTFSDGTSTTRSFAENTAAGQNIGNPVSATDPDGDGGTLSYSLQGTEAENFSIVSGTGQLQTRTGIDYNYETKNSYSVMVRAEDQYGGSATINVTIALTDVTGEAPDKPTAPTVTATSSTSLTVIWIAPANTGPAITDYDVQYRQGSSGAFTGVTHEGTALTTAITDLTPGTTYEVQVQAINAEGRSPWSDSGSRTTRANQLPTFSEASPARSFAENAVAGENIGDAVSATDEETSALTYSLGGNDAASFTIVETSGQLQTKTGVTYDHETKSSYVVTVTAEDEHSGSATIVVRITLNDEIEPPAAPATPTVTAVTLNSLTVIWTEPDNTGPAITDYDVQYRESGGSFISVTHEGTALTTTIMSLTPATTYQMQVRATNDEGPGDWSPLVNETTSVNQVPTFSDGTSATRHLEENTTGTRNIGDAVSATDEETSSLTYSLGGTNAGSFTIVETSGQLRTNDEETYDHETKDSYSVTVTAENEHGGSATIAVTINVKDVAEPPDRADAPKVMAASSTSLTVTWTEPDNTGPVITDYDVQYRIGSSGDFTDAEYTGTDLTTTLTGLTPDRNCEVQVRAENDEGESTWSASGSGATLEEGTSLAWSATLTVGASFGAVGYSDGWIGELSDTDFEFAGRNYVASDLRTYQPKMILGCRHFCYSRSHKSDFSRRHNGV